MYHNQDRNRNYGLRVGDIVEERAFGNVLKGEVIGFPYTDNNACLVRRKDNSEVRCVCEYCHIITKVEDRAINPILNPFQNLVEIRAYALSKNHPLGYCIVKLEDDQRSRLKWLKKFPGCEKKFFTDSEYTTRMLVFFNAEYIKKEINQHKKQIEELEYKLRKAGVNLSEEI